MTGPDYDRKAEELTVKAQDYLGQGEEQSAAVWAAVAQIHATGPRRCYRARDDGRGRSWRVPDGHLRATANYGRRWRFHR